MTTRYLLPCSCGEKLPVEPRQAGQTIKCRCGASLRIPPMLQMKALERAEPEPVAGQVAASPWGVRQSLALLGLVIAALALVVALRLFWIRPLPPNEPRPEAIRRQTQSLSALDAWRFWQSLRASGLDPRRPREDRIYPEACFRYRLAMGVVFVVAALGIALFGGATLSGRYRTAKARPQSNH